MNEMRPSRRMVVGPGGTGRTYLLRSWADEVEPHAGGPVGWLTGHHARPLKATLVLEVMEARPEVLVLDDLQWFDEGALDAVLDVLDSSSANEMSVWASRRPWPMSNLLQATSDLLTESEPATRTGLLASEEFAQIASSFVEGAASTKALDELHRVTAGSLGLAADAITAGWQRDLADLPPQLVEAVANRIIRCGPEAVSLVQLLAVAPPLMVGELIDALDGSFDREYAERATRAGGVLDGVGLLLPVVRSAVLADMSASAKGRIHDRLAAVLAQHHPDHAAVSVLAGKGEVPGSEQVLIDVARDLQRRDPARAIDIVDHGLACGFNSSQLAVIKARAAYEQGSSDALGYLDDLPASAEQQSAEIAYGLDMRDLRWRAAVDRPLIAELANPLGSLARMMSGDVVEADNERPESGLDARMISSLVSSTRLVAAGDTHQGLLGLAESADDFDRMDCDVPFGITPHFIGAAAALSIGDLSMAEGLLDQAILVQSGGEGEETTHRLLRAYTKLVGGSFEEALEAVREGEGVNWSLRDRFLLAAIDAAIARRSGDTTRLRESWKRADPVLVRTSASWLFADLAIELLAAGSRLGETRRVQPIADEFVAQLEGLPSSGAGNVSAMWLRLQIALAGDEGSAIANACEALTGSAGVDDRSSARVQAAGAWAAIQNQSVDDDALSETARRLVSVGDGWEASRLLGQAALDHPDPVVARRLLEEARSLAVEPEAAGESGLVALGLSDREAEVALLVAAGRTYKEVGAQLYVSPKTVEHHVAHIRRKIGASSRAEFLSAIRAATDSEA